MLTFGWEVGVAGGPIAIVDSVLQVPVFEMCGAWESIAGVEVVLDVDNVICADVGFGVGTLWTRLSRVPRTPEVAVDKPISTFMVYHAYVFMCVCMRTMYVYVYVYICVCPIYIPSLQVNFTGVLFIEHDYYINRRTHIVCLMLNIT